MKKSEAGTFSILAISPDSNLMGVGVASGATYVGNRVPHAKPGVGIIVTQAYTNINYGVKGLELLANGFSPEETLNKLLREDSEQEVRQVAIMDFKRRKAIFTGSKAPQWRGEAVGEDNIVIGNLLSSERVVRSMAREFESSSGHLAIRIANALKTGSESGGDKRGEKSAALIVIDREKTRISVKVGLHANPIDELLHRLKAIKE
jgi:uncharacterized Ntn-hydrolase superfamily protein